MKTRIFVILLVSILVLSLTSLQIPVSEGSDVHDVAVVGVLVSPTWIVPAEICLINATVENQGTISENFNVTAYYQIRMKSGNDTVYESKRAIQNVTVLNLGAGENGTITFFGYVFPHRWFIFDAIWPVLEPGNVTVRIGVEADVVLGETDTADNVYVDGEITLTWMIPDADGDGLLSMRDIGGVARKFGGSDPVYDFNRDGQVNMRDVAVSARSFGKIYWF